jgi:hypothetical protein
MRVKSSTHVCWAHHYLTTTTMMRTMATMTAAFATVRTMQWHAYTLAPHLHQLQSCVRKWSLCLLSVSLRASMPTGSSPFDLHELCCALSMHTMMQLGRRALATT